MFNSSHPVMIWVKASGDDAFRVSISENAIVDDLKDAIKKKMGNLLLNCDAPKLAIAATEDGDSLRPGLLISTLFCGYSEDNPIHFRKPADDVQGVCIH
jgi:hypothetical protein